MPLSKIIKKKCEHCGAVAIEKSRIEFGSYKLITLECGHVTSQDTLAESDYSSIVSSDGRSLMPFQIAGIEFAEKANARVLIADEQGLGKTVQALAVVKPHFNDLTPAVAVTKSSLLVQWMWEYIRWTGSRKVQVLRSSKDKPIPGFDFYIVSYDILKVENLFEDVEVKCVIIDECQAIKNHLSGRAKAVQGITKNAEHILALSGTPIKNNAGEYFTILNILQPSRFPEFNRYIRNYCDSYETFYGWKVGGLQSVDHFREATKDFIIRRTRTEVLPDLPLVDRQFHHVDLDKRLSKAYSAALNELDDLMYQDETEDTAANMLAIMAKMRKVAGLSKVEKCIDYLTDFLLSTDRKIVVFSHHHTVTDLVEAGINKWLSEGNYLPALKLTADMNAEQRQNAVNKFKDENYRIMIASTLAAGEGLNLQFCCDAIMLERQWNPANEEQAEGRLIRIGQTSNKVTMAYMIVSETIDEYFTELVEQKRAIMNQTLDGQVVQWEQNSLMKELAQILVTKGKKKWQL